MITIKDPPVIISVGGSIVIPDGGIDVSFLKKLNTFIRNHIGQDRRFFLIIGGGTTFRNYRDAVTAVRDDVSDSDLDWLGVHTTHLNGHLMRTIFYDIAHPRIIENYHKKLRNWKESLVIGAGWKPGWSTDYCSVLLARDYGANLIINLSNIDWVYDKDPNKFPDAKPIKKLTWDEMTQFVGTEWKPGLNAPFDPIATKLAKDLGLTVIVANGKNLKNLDNILEGESFKGTVITPFRTDASYYDREYYTQKKGRLKIAQQLGWFHTAVDSVKNWVRALGIKLFLNPKSALDVGCGTGTLLKHLRGFGIDAYGIELSKDAIDLVPEHLRQYVRNGDVLRLPYSDGEFDLVLSIDVMQHIETSKTKRALDEMIRVSKQFVLNKIYTRNNLYTTLFRGRDYSRVSLFSERFWKKQFNSLEHIEQVHGKIPTLPSFIESVFILRKKQH